MRHITQYFGFAMILLSLNHQATIFVKEFAISMFSTFQTTNATILILFTLIFKIYEHILSKPHPVFLIVLIFTSSFIQLCLNRIFRLFTFNLKSLSFKFIFFQDQCHCF